MSDPFVSHLRLKILLYFVLDSVNFIRAAHNGKVSLLKSNLLFCTIKNALPYTGLTDTISCQSKAKVWTFNTLSHKLKLLSGLLFKPKMHSCHSKGHSFNQF